MHYVHSNEETSMDRRLMQELESTAQENPDQNHIPCATPVSAALHCVFVQEDNKEERCVLD
jgi:hypothetical protein